MVTCCPWNAALGQCLTLSCGFAISTATRYRVAATASANAAAVTRASSGSAVGSAHVILVGDHLANEREERAKPAEGDWLAGGGTELPVRRLQRASHLLPAE